MNVGNDYLKTLRERGKESRVYKEFQLIGLEIAELLKDSKHTALYIKLAKEAKNGKPLQLAQEIAQKKNVKNKGAYFMRVWKQIK